MAMCILIIKVEKSLPLKLICTQLRVHLENVLYNRQVEEHIWTSASEKMVIISMFY